MKKRNKIFILIISELLFLFLILVLMPSIFLMEKSGISQISFDNILSLYQNNNYTQSFISSQNNLNSVSVLIKNPALKSIDQVKIELQNNNQQTIQSLDISGQGIEDPGWVKLKFQPLDSKKGDIFYLKITSNAKKDNDLYIYGNKENQIVNFKTTYKSSNLKDSLKEKINYQKDKFSELNKFQTVFYLTILATVNILIFIIL